jgi:hypothetical protein
LSQPENNNNQNHKTVDDNNDETTAVVEESSSCTIPFLLSQVVRVRRDVDFSKVVKEITSSKSTSTATMAKKALHRKGSIAIKIATNASGVKEDDENSAQIKQKTSYNTPEKDLVWLSLQSTVQVLRLKA